MLITRTSRLTSIERTIDIDCTKEELENWKSGMLIQNAMPNVSTDDREFIMTGITSDEWNKLFEEES